MHLWTLFSSFKWVLQNVFTAQMVSPFPKILLSSIYIRKYFFSAFFWTLLLQWSILFIYLFLSSPTLFLSPPSPPIIIPLLLLTVVLWMFAANSLNLAILTLIIVCFNFDQPWWCSELIELAKSDLQTVYIRGKVSIPIKNARVWNNPSGNRFS